MVTLFTSSSTSLTGDAIIRSLRSNGFPDAAMRPTNWGSGQEQCSIFPGQTDHHITLSDTADDMGRRIIVITANDLAADALQVVVETVKSEVNAEEILGY